MYQVFRDIDVHFCVPQKGIWLRSKETKSFLLLRSCVALANSQHGNNTNNCVGSRDITKLNFTFYSSPPVQIIFTKGIRSYILTGKTAIQRFHLMEKRLNSLGYHTRDLS